MKRLYFILLTLLLGSLVYGQQLEHRTTQDWGLEIAKGRVIGHSGTNKFGKSTNVDNGVDTDLWDGANATDDTDIWVAPTQARIHAIVSTSDADSTGNGGALTLQVYGLTSWSTVEVSETVIMDGTNAVNTTNAYVIIHRMKVLTKGATAPNVGVITATAATDGTVTSQINAGNGQTQQTPYGIPSGQTFYISLIKVSTIKGSASLGVDYVLLVNHEPDVELTNFLTKDNVGSTTEGNNAVVWPYYPYYPVPGPAIIKLQANSSANDAICSGSFDGVLETN